jgi:lipopolysaccharide/colanic/teichoic acid biosynthesis glycosyltransferase
MALVESRISAVPEDVSGVRPGGERLGLALKRAMDVAVAAIMLIVLVPVLAIVAIAVRLDSPGPALFRQRRVGRDGREFSVLKFRSMTAGASPDAHRRYIEQLAQTNGNGDGALRKMTADQRITRIGRLLRKTSVDELPQLLNVLGGQMSLVGPRPAVAYELDHYDPRHFDRFIVKPGMTGLWQVSGRGRLGLQEMLDLDVEYAHRRSLLLDLSVLARTPKAVCDAFTA